MRKLAFIFIAVVLAPSLMLAWLALRSLRDQQFVIERQQAILYSTVADALSREVNTYVSELQRSFGLEVDRLLIRHETPDLAGRFDDVLPSRWPLAEVGFAVATNGAILSPALNARELARRFRAENEPFLAGRQTAEVYLNELHLAREQVQTVGEPQRAADPVPASAVPTANLSLMAARYGLNRREPKVARTVEPQQSTAAPGSDEASFGSDSRSLVAELEFPQLVQGVPQGSVARFVQNRLQLLFWHRSTYQTQVVFGAWISLARLAEELRPLIRVEPPTLREDLCLVLLDDTARPVALSRAGFTANWKKPFVAAEIGEALPHWEIGVYLVDPAWMTRYARLLRLSLGVTILVLVVAIGGGGWLIVRDLQREVGLARQQTDFVSNVSHELKTPLTSIRMFAELLADGRVDDPARQRHYLGIITAEAARLTRLINNVLDFARLERGEKKYRFQPIDLVQVVRDTLNLLRPHLEREGFTLRVSLPPSPIPLHADPDALAQVLLNLLSNAEKYSLDTREIDVELHREEQPLPHAEINVLDRGSGVPRGSEEKIFEKFYRAHDALNSGVPGSGLGLTLARHIARAHGGDLACLPREDRGSRFTLRLPLRPEAAASPAGEAP